MAIDVLRWGDHLEERWRNGRGTTTVIASSPPGSADFDWRISIAQVAGAAEFSSFPGVDRVIMPLDDEPITLVIDGERHDLERLRPFAFDGGASTRCEVAGAMRDLNVMWRREVVNGTVEVRASGRLDAVDGAVRFVVALAGRAVVAGHTLSPGDAVRAERESVDIAGEGTVAVISLVRRQAEG